MQQPRGEGGSLSSPPLAPPRLSSSPTDLRVLHSPPPPLSCRTPRWGRFVSGEHQAAEPRPGRARRRFYERGVQHRRFGRHGRRHWRATRVGALAAGAPAAVAGARAAGTRVGGAGRRGRRGRRGHGRRRGGRRGRRGPGAVLLLPEAVVRRGACRVLLWLGRAFSRAAACPASVVASSSVFCRRRRRRRRGGGGGGGRACTGEPVRRCR